MLTKYSKYLPTLCWLLDIANALYIKFGLPNTSESVEKSVTLLVISVGKLLTGELLMVGSKKLSMDFAWNPTMFKILESINIKSEENIKGKFEIHNAKFRKLFKDIQRSINDTAQKIIDGTNCVHYIRACSFLTMEHLVSITIDNLFKGNRKAKEDLVLLYNKIAT
jgi:hypothetical protein